jgi:sugar O-acyltransferase (sialic acid O-acetyltransferase NeuD family)
MKKIAIIGAGGHAKVVREIAEAIGYEIVCHIVLENEVNISKLYFSDSEFKNNFDSTDVLLANGIGSISSAGARKKAFEKYSQEGFNFPVLIHPSSVVSKSANLGKGTVVMAGTIVQAEVQTGDNVILNSRSVIDHDCSIGSHSHIATGAVLSGGVVIGGDCHIGAGSCLRNNIKIGNNIIIGVGAVVVGDLSIAGTYIGVPAREMKR